MSILNPANCAEYLDELDMEFTWYAGLQDHHDNQDLITVWAALGELKRGDKVLFERLSAISRLVLTIPHSNAAVERMFSQTKKNLTDKRGCIDLSTTLNSIMIVKNTPGCEPCDKVELPKPLLKLAKSATSEYNKQHKT